MYDGYANAYANYTEKNPFYHSDRIGFFYGFGWVRGELCPLHTTTAGVMTNTLTQEVTNRKPARACTKHERGQAVMQICMTVASG